MPPSTPSLFPSENPLSVILAQQCPNSPLARISHSPPHAIPRFLHPPRFPNAPPPLPASSLPGPALSPLRFPAPCIRQFSRLPSQKVRLRLYLSRRQRPPDSRSSHTRAHQIPGYSPCLDQRLDLCRRQCSSPSHRLRHPPPQAVPLSPAFSAGPRRKQIRQDDRLRKGAPHHPQANLARSQTPRPPPRKGTRSRRQTSGNHTHPRRQ